MSNVKIEHFTAPVKTGGDHYDIVRIDAGTHKTRRVVPPAGPKFAFDVTNWGTSIEVCVSPTGRSVQVFINGEKVAP